MTKEELSYEYLDWMYNIVYEMINTRGSSHIASCLTISIVRSFTIFSLWMGIVLKMA